VTPKKEEAPAANKTATTAKKPATAAKKVVKKK